MQKLDRQHKKPAVEFFVYLNLIWVRQIVLYRGISLHLLEV